MKALIITDTHGVSDEVARALIAATGQDIEAFTHLPVSTAEGSLEHLLDLPGFNVSNLLAERDAEAVIVSDGGYRAMGVRAFLAIFQAAPASFRVVTKDSVLASFASFIGDESFSAVPPLDS